MSCFFHLFQSVLHGAHAFGKPVDGNIQEKITWATSHAAGNQGPACRAIKEYDLEAEATFEAWETPYSKATTKASLVFTALDETSVAHTVTAPNMLIGEAGFKFSGERFPQTQKFAYNGTVVDALVFA